MLIVFCVWSLSSLLFVVFGICALSAKKPMPFWTHDWANDKEINISDVKAYNKAVAFLYFVYAFTILILGVPIASILMIAVYAICIEAKYRR